MFISAKNLLYFIKACIFFSFLTPLIVSDKFIFPFVFPKTAAFQILVEVMVLAWVFLMAENHQYRPALSRLAWAIGIFLAIAFISSILGVNFSHSFWSNYERMTGLFTLLHYFAYFMVLASVMKTKKDWLFLFDGFIGAGIIVSFIALFQQLGLGIYLSGQGRVSASLGNPAYLAAYMLFILFAIVFMFFQRRERNFRFYYGAVFAFSMLIFYLTKTRGAMLGLAIGLGVFFLAMIFWPKTANMNESLSAFGRKMRKIALAALIGLVLFFSFLYFGRDSTLVNSSDGLSRLAHISFTEGTTQTRLLAWKLSWQGFKEKPILGWGWENYNVVFNKYYDPLLYPTENWFDRAHNLVFDLLVATGAIGFIGYFGIFATAIWLLWKAFRRQKLDFFNFALISALIAAYLFQDLFVFDMLFSYLPLFTILAFINWISVPVSQKEIKPLKLNAFAKILAVGAFIFIVFFGSIKPGLANISGIKAMSSGNLGIDVVTNNFKRAFEYGTFGRFEIRLQVFESAKNLLGNYEQYNDEQKKIVADFTNFALQEAEKTLKEQPLDTRYNLIIGQLFLAAAQVDPANIRRANDILEMVLSQSPNRQITLFSLGEATIRNGNIEKGLSYFQRAIDLNNKILEPHWNLALIYFSIGDEQKGREKLDEITAKFGVNAFDADMLRRLGAVFITYKDYGTANFYLDKALELNPNDANAYVGLAGLYLGQGDKQRAKNAIQKAAQLNPDLKPLEEQYLKKLGE
ncbi:MAG: O-antigen ligase family protein [Candidatus Portnoybacteria bacterium]|nr:O-antigen ligase family protein [Candidatus Portnoybacteria bacterium]